MITYKSTNLSINLFIKIYSVYKLIIKIVTVVASLSALGLLIGEAVLRKFYPAYLNDWGLELAIYLIAWAVLLTGGILVTENEHVTANFFEQFMPQKLKVASSLIVSFLGIIFTIVVAFYALDVVIFAINMNEVSDTSLQFPKYLFYLSLMISMSLMCLHYLFQFAFIIKRYNQKQ